MRKGALRWDEMMLAEHAARQSRWAPATERAKADAAPALLSGRANADVASSSPYPLVTLCRAAGLPEPIPEYKFHPLRKWRADYAWPIHKVITEIEGGIWMAGGGAHSRPANILRDMEKYNAAALLGFAVLRYTPQQLGDAVRDLRIMLAR